jgi:Tol biopolymer transport system component
MTDGINTAFDTDGDSTKIVQLIQPTQIFVNQDELRQNGHTFEDVAEYVMTLTKGQTALPTVTVPADQQQDKVFQAAYPSKIMQRLPCLPEARG